MDGRVDTEECSSLSDWWGEKLMRLVMGALWFGVGWGWPLEHEVVLSNANTEDQERHLACAGELLESCGAWHGVAWRDMSESCGGG